MSTERPKKAEEPRVCKQQKKCVERARKTALNEICNRNERCLWMRAIIGKTRKIEFWLDANFHPLRLPRPGRRARTRAFRNLDFLFELRFANERKP